MGEYWLGVIMGGAGVALFILLGVLGGEEGDCEREHNVYDCTRVYVPAPTEE